MQLVAFPLPLRLHVVAENVPVPAPLRLQVTVPVGVVLLLPCASSATEAVQVVGEPKATVAPLQVVTVVVVGLRAGV